MTTQDFSTSFTVNQPPKAVFEAICNVRGWWSENIEGDTTSLNSIFCYQYQDVHMGKFKITKCSPHQIVWHVTENRFNFTKDQHEWEDSNIIFDITALDNHQTRLTFTHQKLTPAYECYALCKDAWTHYIQGSLQSLITTGLGAPTPKQDKQTKPESPTITNPSATTSIHHQLRIEAPIETVYNALTTKAGLKGWWTPEVEMENTIHPGTIIVFSFGSKGQHIKIIVEALHHYDLIKWRCFETNPDWDDTIITFELKPHVKGAVLHFSHTNWKDYSDEFAGCSYVWALFLRSLKRLCETGKGLPFPAFDQ